MAFDPEWLALREGLKPAIRILAAKGEGAAIAARFVSRGASVVFADPAAVVNGTAVDIVYVARREREAAAVRDAEHPLVTAVGGSVRDQARANEDVGRLLGFPRCCVESFCARIERGVNRLVPRGPSVFAEDYVAARDALVPRPDARLDNLLLASGVRLVTFYPCRYDCGVAIRYADAILAAMERRQPGAASSLVRELARDVALSPSGARCVVALDARGVIVRAEAPPRSGGTPDPTDVALARVLEGSRIGEDGRAAAATESGEAAWVFRFSAP